MYNVKITSDLLLVIDICHIKIVRTRLGVDRVIKVHRRSEKAMEGHGRSWKVFSCHWIDISGEKSYWWWWWWSARIIVSAPVPVPFLWTLDFRLGTWIWDWTWP